MRLGEHTLQLLPGPERSSYARVRVEVQEWLDGSVVVAYQGSVIASKKAPPLPVTLRARKNWGAHVLNSRIWSPPLRWTPAKKWTRGVRRLKWAPSLRIPAHRRANHPSENPAPIILGDDPWW